MKIKKCDCGKPECVELYQLLDKQVDEVVEYFIKYDLFRIGPDEAFKLLDAYTLELRNKTLEKIGERAKKDAWRRVAESEENIKQVGAVLLEQVCGRSDEVNL